MKTWILMISMISSLCSLALASTGEYKMRQLGSKILVTHDFDQKKPKFVDQELGLFCERLESFSKKYIQDYDEYGCDLINEHNQIICEMTQKGISRNSSGINAFGTNLNDQIDLLLIGGERDYEQVRTDIALEQGIDRKQIVIADEFAQYQLGRAQISWQREGIFKRALEVGRVKSGLEIINANVSSNSTPLLQTRERYLACAIRSGEASLMISATARMTVKDPIENKLLSKLWETYQKLKSHWESINPSSEELRGGVQLIRLGAKMGELQRAFERDPTFAKDSRFKMEDWFSKFFIQVLDEDYGLSFEAYELADVSQFERELYPAAEYPVSLVKFFEVEVDRE